MVKKIERWVASKNGTPQEQDTYKKDFRWLIRSESREQFEEQLKDVKDNAWDEAFTKYFEKNIEPQVDSLAAWKLEEIGFPISENSTITNNQCESLNALMKDWQEGQRVPIDTGALVARDIQKAKNREMARCFMAPGGNAMQHLCFVCFCLFYSKQA